MAVKYRRWDADDRVSAQWYAVLARRRPTASLPRHDGHRTMGEQQGAGTRSKHGGALAARPGPTAPHISGRPARPRDRRQRARRRRRPPRRVAAAHGAARVVPGPGRGLAHRGAARRPGAARRRSSADPLAGYPAKERHWIRTYDTLVRLKHAGHDPADGRAGAPRCARLMTDRRKAIWRAAQHTGWHQLKRRARYRSLLARTTNP